MAKFRTSDRMGKLLTNSTVRYKPNLRTMFTVGSCVKNSVTNGSRSE